MTREELKKRIQGTPATIPTAFDDNLQLDLGRQKDLTQWWMENGLGTDVAALKVAAAMGESAALSDAELPKVMRAVVDAAGKDATIICALKTKDTLNTIEDAKMAQDMGAIGLQIELPMFHKPNQDDYVRYFTDISDAVDIGVMIYNTHWFGCQSLNAETILRMKDAEHVVAIKWAVPESVDYDEMRQFSDTFNVIDNSNQPVRCHKNGGQGYISVSIPAYPQHDLKVWELLEAKQYDEAHALYGGVRASLDPWLAKTAKRSGGQRQFKGMMTIVGHPAGPPRPPTLPIEEDELQELRGLFKEFGWPVVA